ncbi:MAG: IS256 family transposase [Tissierellia bacterium]|nr:IS256 family transposase [Tissierellia bacterium]
MAQLNITLDTDLLKNLFSLDGKEKAYAKLMECILNQVLEHQAIEQTGAGLYERTQERQAYRNGYRDRTLKTRIGTLTLTIPRLRNGNFSTELFTRYQRNEQALVLAMMEMVINGVSTRKVATITEELCGTTFSKSTVSSLCEKLDPVVSAFRNRPLQMAYPYLIVDAIYTKVREAGAVRSKGLLLAIGVNEDGFREILGFMASDTESEGSWGSFFSSMKERGLKGVDLVVSDAHKGLVRAIGKHFQGASWQRCQTHFSRNMLDMCPKRHQPTLQALLKSLYESIDYEAACMVRDRILTEYENSAPRACILLEEAFDDITQILRLPINIRRRLRTSNAIERVNEEIRRRERVIRIFPNEDSLHRLIGAVLMDIHEDWQTGRRYLSLP